MTQQTRDLQAVADFVERLASALVEGGVPRMPARVFAALHATDSGRMTAAELAERLQASPGAISGAVRYLLQVRLIRREREPGSRRDVYVVQSDNWYEAMTQRDDMLATWVESMRRGVEALGPDTPAGMRTAETLAFFEFLRDELPAMMDRWREERERLRATGG